MSRRKKKSPGIITPVSLEALLSLWDEPARKKAAARPSRPRRKKEVPEAESGEMMSRDQFMREPLFDWLEEQFGRVRILEEIEIGASRADAVMVLPEAVAGIEIKSDHDSYARLARQVKDYDLYFDYNYVAVGTSHAMHVEEHVPEYWGIITAEEVDGAADFYLLRRAKENPKREMKRKLSLLWRGELNAVREGYVKHKYAEKTRAFLAEKILEAVPEEEMQRRISEALFEREYR